ncbi:hypothetical protein SASPL_104969 [Salvia splendens]|uniref:Retrotransposon gag domain-containing protein n=1 Tax=Salvia splendens TaxID=180675 RepID=A0A8X8YKV4_SALSN|nr:hypothetical protein SASPL_104969 [Salvia splendens]
MPLDQGQQGQTDHVGAEGEKDPKQRGLIKLVVKQLAGDHCKTERGHEAGVVTTRYRAALAAAASSSTAEQLTSEEEGELSTPVKQEIPLPEEAEAKMVVVDNDWGIGSLHAHDEKEPTHAITVTLGIRALAVKLGVLAVLSNFYGLPKECPYAFLKEFCRYCDIQPVLAGSTSEDYRLKAIPFVLKGDVGIWLRRMPKSSIRTWAEFHMIFLDRFFPTSKTSALKREITKARQEYDEPLGQYWDKFQGLLQECPNHKMGEREVHSTFYGGLTVDNKNDLNLAAQGDFSKTLFSQAKNILERLIEAKRSYETSRGQYRRGEVHAAEARSNEKLGARFEQMEKKLLEAVEKTRAPPSPAPKEKTFRPPAGEEHHA